jgi:hypothetical protein
VGCPGAGGGEPSSDPAACPAGRAAQPYRNSRPVLVLSMARLWLDPRKPVDCGPRRSRRRIGHRKRHSTGLSPPMATPSIAGTPSRPGVPPRQRTIGRGTGYRAPPQRRLVLRTVAQRVLAGREIDFDSTLVAGSDALIDDLLHTSLLETFRLGPGDSLMSNADRINAGPSDEGPSRR